MISLVEKYRNKRISLLQNKEIYEERELKEMCLRIDSKLEVINEIIEDLQNLNK